MKFINTEIEGLFVIEQNVTKDYRGSFVKNFNYSEFEKNNCVCDFRESFYTKSKEDVIRGMHFQVPPYDQIKLITVISGTIIDVILDIRKFSKTYGQYFAIELSRENRKSLYIPTGLAHGFGVLSEQAIAYYQVTNEYHPESDTGILYDSFEFQWPIANPIISERDKSFAGLIDYQTPFHI